MIAPENSTLSSSSVSGRGVPQIGVKNTQIRMVSNMSSFSRLPPLSLRERAGVGGIPSFPYFAKAASPITPGRHFSFRTAGGLGAAPRNTHSPSPSAMERGLGGEADFLDPTDLDDLDLKLTIRPHFGQQALL